MPRSSRHKSHKQHKNSSKDGREHSFSEEDRNLKDRKGREQTDVRVSKESVSGEKRRLFSQSQDAKDPFGLVNGDLSEEYGSSKRRKDKGLVRDKETKAEGYRSDSEKGPKSKVSVDSKSKSSRRHDSVSERKEENVCLAGNELKKNSSKVESEKDSSRKEVHQSKDAKEKQRSHSEVFEEGVSVKRRTEITEWQIHHELRNPDLEKELEKRVRRRTDGSGEKDKFQVDVRDSSDRRLSSRDDHAKDGRYKDERHKDGRYRDKYLDDVRRDNRHQDDKHRDERSSRDHTSDRPDIKNSKDENKTAEIRHKKFMLQDSDRDDSAHLEERSTKFKDNKGKKRSSDDNEDHSDIKSRITKKHCSDVEKKPLSTSKVESVADRGRSHSHHADVDSTVRTRRSSPSSSSHVAKYQYRHLKQADSKDKDSVLEERVWSNATSIRKLTGISGVLERASESRSVEKPIQKDDNHLGELSDERSPRSDAHASSMQLMDKSPSSSSIDCRYSNRTSVRRSLDVEEMGQRSSGSKDARDYSGDEDRVSREFPLEKPPVEESQADGDTGSVSSTFNRISNSSSRLPPLPFFRAGVDSPSVFGSSEEDSKGKSNNRYRRNGEPNVGRGQGNAWKGVPNWPSLQPNGFIPFQHGPPPGGFHAVMQQFPVPPLFGVRPLMELNLNHTGVPYHIPDADRFSSHGRTFGWQNSADDSGPHLHRWDGSNGFFGDESQKYGRSDWDQKRHSMSGRGWEMNADMWKGQNDGANMELPSAAPKEDYVVRAPEDEVWAGQSGQRSLNERNRPRLKSESIEIKRCSDSLPTKDTSETPKAIHAEPSKLSSDDDSRFFHVYLSQLDISADLTRPELYNMCMSLLDMERNTTVNEDVTKHMHVEDGVEPRVKISNTTFRASTFPTIKDSVFQRAMALYKKQREEMRAIIPISSFDELKLQKMPVSDGEKLVKLESVLTSDLEKVEVPVPISNQEKADVPVLTSDQEIAEAVPTSEQENAEEPVPTPVQKVEEPVPTLDLEKPGELFFTFGDQKPEEPVVTSNQEKVEIVTTSYQEKLADAVEDCFSSLENASRAATNSPSKDEGMNRACNAKGNLSAYSPEVQQVLVNTLCGPVLFSDGSSEACEALMPELIESESVNLSRIHHSPENTH